MGPGEIDVEVVRRHLAAQHGALSVLAARSEDSIEELEADTELLWIVERGLQLCCQNVLDIATHIAAGRGATSRTMPARSTSSGTWECLTASSRGSSATWPDSETSWSTATWTWISTSCTDS
jgi:hypothetical protein